MICIVLAIFTVLSVMVGSVTLTLAPFRGGEVVGLFLFKTFGGAYQGADLTFIQLEQLPG